MKYSKLILGLPAIVLLACSQPDHDMTMKVAAEPIYNKMGEVTGCTDGREPNSTWRNPCEPPDGCILIPGTNICDPDGGRGSDDSSDGDDRPNTPGTAPRG